MFKHSAPDRDRQEEVLDLGPEQLFRSVPWNHRVISHAHIPGPLTPTTGLTLVLSAPSSQSESLPCVSKHSLLRLPLPRSPDTTHLVSILPDLEVGKNKWASQYLPTGSSYHGVQSTLLFLGHNCWLPTGWEVCSRPL